MISPTHARKTAFSRPSAKFPALQRPVKLGWDLSVEREEIKGEMSPPVDMVGRQYVVSYDSPGQKSEVEKKEKKGWWW